MDQLPQIQIPWKQQWRRIRYAYLPVIILLICVLLVVWLWRRQGGQPQGVGEFNVEQVVASAACEGQLVKFPVELLTSVRRGAVVARFDDKPVRTGLLRLKRDLGRLRDDLPKNGPTTEPAADPDHRALRACAIQVESLRIKLLEQRVAGALELVDQRQELMMQAADNGSDDDEDLRLQTPRATTSPTEAQAARKAKLDAIRKELDGAVAQLKALPPAPPDLEKALAPVRSSLAASETRLKELETHFNALDVLAPVDGRLTSLHHRLKDNVRLGDAIATITAEEAQYVLTYLRQDQRVPLDTTVSVDIRPRAPGRSWIRTTIQRIGARFERIPDHQLRDHKVPEWGLPIYIALPKDTDLRLRPGEMVDVRFRSAE